VKGVLTSDAQARQPRFESASGTLFEVSFDQLTALHYEESLFPPFRGFGRSRSYLTIHYTTASGDPGFEILRLSKDPAPDLLAALERDTGLSVDRGPATASFLGLPIHTAIGDTVYVTDDAGHRGKGTVRRLSPSSIELQPSGRFEAASVQKVEVSDPTGDGAARGAVLGGLLSLAAELFGCLLIVNEDHPLCQEPLLFGAIGVVGGAILGRAADAHTLRAAYIRTRPSQSRGVQWTPVLGPNKKGIRVSLHF
jgi:hypothetical protein